MQVDAEQLYARLKSAQSKKDEWTSVLRDCYELAMPMRNPYNSDPSGKNANRLVDRMYESTAMLSTWKAANRMLLELVPPGQDWFSLKPGPMLEIQLGENKAALEELQEYLAKIVQIMAMVFQSGSFEAAIHEAFLDLLVTGIGVMLVLENPGDDEMPVIFESVPQHEVSIEEGPGGSVIGVYRTRKAFEARKIKMTWTDAEIPEEITKMIEDTKKKDEPAKVDLFECAYKNPKGQGWYYELMWKQKDNDPKKLVKRTYSTNPWMTFRWSKVAGSPYGPGPVLLSLPDIRTANKIMEMSLKNAALALAGMYMVRDDGVVNPDNFRIVNGGLIPVQSTGGGAFGASIAPLETGRNFDIGQVVLDDVRMQIKKGLLDNALPPLEGNVRSATEIIQRMRELTQEFGGAIGRLTNELIIPLVRRVADILANRGYIDPINVNQYLIKVQVNSPLARAQQMQEVERVIQWLEIVMSLGGQEAMALVAKMEDIFPWIADKIGVPMELVRNEDERAEIEQQYAQIVAAQAAPANDPSQLQAAA